MMGIFNSMGAVMGAAMDRMAKWLDTHEALNPALGPLGKIERGDGTMFAAWRESQGQPVDAIVRPERLVPRGPFPKPGEWAEALGLPGHPLGDERHMTPGEIIRESLARRAHAMIEGGGPAVATDRCPCCGRPIE